VLPTDVSDAEAVDAAATQAEADLGPIDVWVNNAMTTTFSPVEEISPAEFRRAIEVTFLGQVWGTTAALARMRPRDRGSIVNVGSALAFIGIPLQSAYCASKFACRGFFESTRAELIHEHSTIRLSMVQLPAVTTPQFDWCHSTLSRHPQPVPPIYQPEVPARVIVRTALDGRRARVVGGWNRLLVLAGSWWPGVGNQYAARAAWESQLTDRPIRRDRPDNLWHPADAEVDAGARGIFDDRAHGMLEPSFVASLPGAATTFVRSVAAAARERARRPLAPPGRHRYVTHVTEGDERASRGRRTVHHHTESV
jgi:NAD(P)-dependent dehydrogenase (short-subunit alcohol dehydrogenase family)